jgi:hypothetical protein
MRKTRNITVAVSNERYRKARKWAVEHDYSLSEAVAVLIENLEFFDSLARRHAHERPNCDATTRNTKVDFWL